MKELSLDHLEAKQSLTQPQVIEAASLSDSESALTAQLFADVFAGHPWNEVSKCPLCAGYSDQSPGLTCKHCQACTLKAAYPLEETQAAVTSVFNYPGSKMVLVRSEEILGFAWGYLVKSHDLVGKFIPSEKERLLDILEDSTDGNHEVFSAAEVGLSQSLRGTGLGKKMLSSLLDHAALLNVPTTVWTRHDTVLTPICLKFGFRQIYGPQVALTSNGASLTQNHIIGIDKNTPERVLFIYP